MKSPLWNGPEVSRAALASVAFHIVAPLAASGLLLAWLFPDAPQEKPIPSFTIEARLDSVSALNQEVPELEIIPPELPEPTLEPAQLEETLPEEVLPIVSVQLRPESGKVEAAPDPNASPAPDYPRAARRLNQQGEVLLWVDVSAIGNVLALGIEQSSGFPILDQAALSTVAEWSFTPGKSFGVFVRSKTIVSILFEIEQ